MKVFATAALMGGILALGGVSTASAQEVEFSGRVFHIKACPANQGAGKARCFAHIVTDSRGNPIATPARHGGGGGGPPAGYGPTQLRAAYGITGAGSPGTTVAIVDAYGYPRAASDLATYRAQFKLPPANLTIVNETGGNTLPNANTGWDQEQALDLDMVSTMCPSCSILLVQASSASFADLAAAVNYAAGHAHVVSNSYGGGENGSSSYEGAYNHPTVAITASTGDSGYGAQFPATSPHVIAVGGTSLTTSTNARGWSETAWSGGGSGCSVLYGQPMWQQPSNSNMANNTMCTNRMEADVSADADPSTGVAVYGPASSTSSAWLVFGGTSVAAPLVGGIFGVNGGGVSYASTLYATYKTQVLNDITSGSNSRNCTLGYYCSAEAGYDGPTGLGTPNGDSAF